MASRKRPEKEKLSQEQMRRYLVLILIPVIIIVLILVIVLTDRSSNHHETIAAAATESQTESRPDAASDGQSDIQPDGGTETDGAGDTQEYAYQFDEYELKKNEIPEINALMEAYCQAKSSCDAETMYQLYRKTDTSDIEEVRAQMELRSKYIESFQNINCYTEPGLDDQSYVVYVSADIKFRVTDTLAPNLMWCYVTQDENGEFYIVENPSQEVLDYVARIEQTEDVRLLAAQISQKLEEAAASDTRLASAYGILKAGSPETEAETEAQTQEETQTEPETGVEES